MNRKNAGQPEGRESSSVLTYVRILIVYPAFALLACIALLAAFAIAVLPRLIAGSISLLVGSVGSLLAMCFGVLTFIAYATWLLLWGEWGQLISLLPEVLDWLRSFGLL